jgi:cytochrome c peroxidase
VATLAEVIDNYARTGRGRSVSGRDAAAPADARLRPFTISSDEKEDLLTFLRALTDPEFLGDARFAAP